jgi:hypothetical protein
MQDLVLLVADKNMQFALQGALARPQALGIRPISYAFRSHMGRDGGVRTTGAAVLAGEAARFQHALMLLDVEGCGKEGDPLGLECQLDQELHLVWGERGKAIVIAPEVDVWLWGADNALREAVQWPEQGPIRSWLEGKGFEFNTDGKPLRPKEALDAMRPVHKQPRSSALYQKITGKISLKNCTDAAFVRLRDQLRMWFPA